MMSSLTITILCLCLTLGSAIKMRGAGVSSDTGSLSTVDHTEVKCDYVRWRQEEFFSIKWSVKYPGVETSFLQYWNDGRKYTVNCPTYIITLY